MRTLFISIILLIAANASAQKKVIDHTAYNDWKKLSRHQISNDGKFVTYEIKPHRGDGYLYIYDVENNELDSIYRAKNAEFSGTSSYVAFTITPGFDTLRTCDLEKVDKKKWPKDSLGIYVLGTKEITKYSEVKSFQVNDESDWMGYQSYGNDLKEESSKKKKRWCKRKKKEEKTYTSKGKLLTILNPISGESKTIKNVKSWEVSENATYVALTTHQKADADSFQLNLFIMDSKELRKFPKNYTDIPKFGFSDQEDRLFFVSSEDSAKVKCYALNLLDCWTMGNQVIADSSQAFLPEGDAMSNNYTPRFTEDGSMLYFGVAEKPKEEPKDTLTDSEKVKLDLWHHKDKRLQPEQLLRLERDKKKTDLHVLHIEEGRIVKLADDTLRTYADTNPKGEYILASSIEAYQHTYNWVAPYPEDHYRISLKTGESELLKRGIDSDGELSPEGNYYVYYDNEKHNYFALNLLTKEEKCITCSIDNVNWEADVNGMPMKAWSLGIIGWKKGEEKIYLQSEFDIWEYDFVKNEAASTTGEIGSTRQIELGAYWWSYDSVFVDFDNVYVQGFNRKTKGVHLFNVKEHGEHTDLIETSSYDAIVYGKMRSKNKSTGLLRKMTTLEYPDLYLINNKFEIEEKISVTNPQQVEYNWTSVELIKWKDYKGTELEGLLYKPENYDASKEYPLMVYFYELYSDRLHQHYIPKPTASIVYATEYASAGYFVFIPDIRYTSGHPAQSAYDAIMSGTDRVLELYDNVDSTRMALQGQSWGGYQTAQLVTMTTRYKAAMAGAPVTNMFSAYGGIRWGSGLNRQFQYERTQSRIGYTIWERPDLYVENSPQFHLPNVQTPLMIMHNDGDGAVPWYQGIELFTGLKRLGKPTWLLNYNGEQHNLMQNANRIDLSIRMRQFFDHYLLGKEAPQWLKEGIPATVKGKELRY
ncbi:MAG: prolyl oligopeptidase family serine peptidase [Crocinitomicaceae bacterium]|nr:prolyl oligopeptidase family serine peptidase [Crocinitomicaceae bacterium]